MKSLQKILPFFLLLITWKSVEQWVSFKIFLGGYWIEHILQSLFLVFLATYYYQNPSTREKTPFPFKLYYIIVFIETIYGIYMARGYQDFQLMVTNVINCCFGLTWFYFQVPQNVSNITSRWCRFSIPLFFCLVLFMDGEAVGRFFSPFAFLLFFFPYLEKKWKVRTLVVVAFVLLFGALGARSSVLRFAIAIVFALAIYLHKIIPKVLIKIVAIILFVAPVALFVLGIQDQFNIFKLQEEMGWDDVEVTNSFDAKDKENLGADTRTFLYVEEIQSAVDNDYVLWGRSLSRGYDSQIIEGTDWMLGRNERWSSEVRILNVFNHMGLIGVVIVGLLYFCAAFNAVFRSKSFGMQLIGLYVSYRWLYAWIEDFERYDLINLYLWIPIVMCYSSKFLNMTDSELKSWVQNLFKKNTCLKK